MRERRNFEPWEINDAGAVNLVLAIYKQPAREYVGLVRKIRKAKPGDNTYRMQMRAGELKQYFIHDPYGLFDWEDGMLCEKLEKLAMTGDKANWMRGENGRWQKRD